MPQNSPISGRFEAPAQKIVGSATASFVPGPRLQRFFAASISCQASPQSKEYAGLISAPGAGQGTIHLPQRLPLVASAHRDIRTCWGQTILRHKRAWHMATFVARNAQSQANYSSQWISLCGKAQGESWPLVLGERGSKQRCEIILHVSGNRQNGGFH